MSRAGRWRAILACLAIALLWPAGAWVWPAGASAARPLQLGFGDGAFTGPDGQTWLHRSAEAGADMVRIEIAWVVPDTAKRPAGLHARNPADPHYDFTQADAAVRLATWQGLRVLLTFTGAPRWAEGPGRPADAQPGSWRPDPQALGDYGAALARRYSGRFPDPANPGHVLPRVAAFQVWNEPNLSLYLSPQWSGGAAVAPAIYRNMLNAFYRGVKSVDPRAVVVTAGTAPFGDFPGGQRMMPALFWRDVFCLREVAGHLRGTSCRDPAHFDVFAHHPYSVGAPTTSALNADDVSIPDLGKLTILLRAAERAGRALPRVRHPLWITEVSYNSYPPDPGGVPVNEHARWLEQSLEELWRAGAQVVIWNQIGDQPPVPSYGATSQSGVYYLNGRPKPALLAFRFPLVAWRSGRSAVEVWGRTPVSGRLLVQQRVGSAWKTIRTLGEHARATFLTQISDPNAVSLRAQIGGKTSLIWHLA